MASSIEYLAFAAGLYAFFNPCGIAMLPAYVSYYIESDEAKNKNTLAKTIEGAILGLLVSLGFLLLFAAAGLIIAYIGKLVFSIVPYISIAVGLLLVMFGFAWLLGKNLFVLSYLDNLGNRLKDARPKNRYISYFLYGVGYGIVSISCTIPVFLTIVLGTLMHKSIFEGAKLFFIYGLAMSLVMVTATILIALFKDTIQRYLKVVYPYLKKIGAIVLIFAGSYVIYYQANVLRVLT